MTVGADTRLAKRRTAAVVAIATAIIIISVVMVAVLLSVLSRNDDLATARDVGRKFASSDLVSSVEVDDTFPLVLVVVSDTATPEQIRNLYCFAVDAQARARTDLSVSIIVDIGVGGEWSLPNCEDPGSLPAMAPRSGSTDTD